MNVQELIEELRKWPLHLNKPIQILIPEGNYEFDMEFDIGYVDECDNGHLVIKVDN